MIWHSEIIQKRRRKRVHYKYIRSINNGMTGSCFVFWLAVKCSIGPAHYRWLGCLVILRCRFFYDRGLWYRNAEPADCQANVAVFSCPHTMGLNRTLTCISHDDCMITCFTIFWLLF